MLYPMPWTDTSSATQTALRSFHPYGFRRRQPQEDLMCFLLATRRVQTNARHNISWSKISPEGTWKRRLTGYTLCQCKRSGTEVNETDWPDPKRSIRKDITKKNLLVKDISWELGPPCYAPAILNSLLMIISLNAALARREAPASLQQPSLGGLVARGRNMGDRKSLRSELTELIVTDWHEESPNFIH